MFALKFEIRATANNTNMFVEQETVVNVSLNEKATIDKACMIGMGAFATPREMKAASDFLSIHLLKTKSESKFEEVTSAPLTRGSYRILAKRV